MATSRDWLEAWSSLLLFCNGICIIGRLQISDRPSLHQSYSIYFGLVMGDGLDVFKDPVFRVCLSYYHTPDAHRTNVWLGQATNNSLESNVYDFRRLHSLGLVELIFTEYLISIYVWR